jgi:hypothetical protein
MALAGRNSAFEGTELEVHSVTRNGDTTPRILSQQCQRGRASPLRGLGQSREEWQVVLSAPPPLYHSRW